MLDYAALNAVASVARTGSFEAAARELGVTPSAISQRIKNLEVRLGFKLIERSAPARATDKGEWLCRHMERVGLLEHELLAAVPALGQAGGQAGGPAGLLTIPVAVNSDSLATWFMPAFATWQEGTGHLLQLVVEEEAETARWLAHGRVLAAVTSQETPVAGCRRTGLGSLHYAAVASPAYVARYLDEGVTAQALARAPALTFSRHDGLQRQWLAQTFAHPPTCPSHWLPSTQGFLEACRRGIGWGMNPMALAEPLLARGELVELVPGARLVVPLFWQVNRLAADSLLPLTRAVQAAAAQVLVPA